MSRPEWLFDEGVSSGTDYASAEQAAAHEAMMDRLKDRRQEAGELVASLDLTERQTLIDLGCGSGHVAVAAAGACQRVLAVDASPVMLDLARRRARDGGAANIEFHHAGFLTYEHDSFITRSVARWRESGHPEVAEEIERHVHREYGTFGWVMAEMLRRAGFRIDQMECRHGVEAEYRCTKQA